MSAATPVGKTAVKIEARPAVRTGVKPAARTGVKPARVQTGGILVGKTEARIAVKTAEKPAVTLSQGEAMPGERIAARLGARTEVRRRQMPAGKPAMRL